MTPRIPNIIIDTPKPLRLKDKVVGWDKNGWVRDVSNDRNPLGRSCANCGYMVRNRCTLTVLCGLRDMQYYEHYIIS
jgi:hypothetical protein